MSLPGLVVSIQSDSRGAWVDRGFLVLSWSAGVSLSERSKYFGRDGESIAVAHFEAELASGRSVQLFEVLRRPVRLLMQSGNRVEFYDECLNTLRLRVEPFCTCRGRIVVESLVR